MEYKELFSLIGLIIAVFSLAWATYGQTMLQKKKFAVEMIHEWNSQTAEDRRIIELAYPGIYDKCKRLDKEEAKNIVNSDESANDEKRQKVKQSIIRLLNYYEFISSAYLNGTANKRIIHDSFATTMVRFYCILEEYVIQQVELTKQNPWIPYIKFIKIIISSKNIQKCIYYRDEANPVCYQSKLDIKFKIEDLLKY